MTFGIDKNTAQIVNNIIPLRTRAQLNSDAIGKLGLVMWVQLNPFPAYDGSGVLGSVAIPLAGDVQFTAKVYDIRGVDITSKCTLVWTNPPLGNATIDQNGLAHGAQAGVDNIRVDATLSNGATTFVVIDVTVA